MSKPIRYHDPLPDGRAFLLTRQCALCDHACLEHEWHCACCGQIDHVPHIAHCSGGRSRNRVYGPLLPPHVPPHVWPVLRLADVPQPEGDSPR
jgi:hypothetical protein